MFWGPHSFGMPGLAMPARGITGVLQNSSRQQFVEGGSSGNCLAHALIHLPMISKKLSTAEVVHRHHWENYFKDHPSLPTMQPLRILPSTPGMDEFLLRGGHGVQPWTQGWESGASILTSSYETKLFSPWASAYPLFARGLRLHLNGIQNPS